MNGVGYCPKCEADIMPVQQWCGNGALGEQRCPMCQTRVPLEYRAPKPDRPKYFPP